LSPLVTFRVAVEGSVCIGAHSERILM
jgi:hypothetical protein